MYEVDGKTFNSFDDVIAYAWNTYKISYEAEGELNEEEKQAACKELHHHINNNMDYTETNL